MALIEMPRHATPERRRQARDAALMRLAIYPACLFAAAAGRLAGQASRDASQGSVFAEARAQASACIAFAFR